MMRSQLSLALVLALGGAPLASVAAQGKPAVPARPEAAKPAPARPAPKKPADPAAAPAPKPGELPAKKDASLAFFRTGVIPRLKITIPDGELQRLREKNREYVRCNVLEEGGKEYTQVGIKLKGAAGSFRGVDDRPALTLNFDKYNKDQEFHDLDKIHLNNSVQDPSYLNELVCSELFLAAGVPAARATHARVWLNGRDLGFYVLKEGFGKDFLKRNKLDPKGNLYEGGFVQDLDGQPELDSGEGPIDRSDVKAVIAACREGDPAKRWQKLEQVVDLDQFFSFMAMELLTCHWDGYCNNRNNYRYYFDPKTQKIQFFPHGMDQMFQDTGFSVLNVPGSMVCQAVMSNPEWRARYRERLSELSRLFVPEKALLERVEIHHQRMRPVLLEMGQNRASEFDERVKDLKNRLTARARSVAEQNAVAEALPMRFSPEGIALLTRWAPRSETPDAKVEARPAPGGKPAGGVLAIATGPGGRCVASWRMKVLLTAGKYRLEGRARTQSVKALAESSGAGAGLRLSGGSRANKLDGTMNWTPLSHEFQIQGATQEVELVAELRATAGEVQFDADSLRLVRVAK